MTLITPTSIAHPAAGRFDSLHGDEDFLSDDAAAERDERLADARFAEECRLWVDATSDLLCDLAEHHLFDDLRTALLECNRPLATPEMFARVGRLLWMMMDDEAVRVARDNVAVEYGA